MNVKNNTVPKKNSFGIPPDAISFEAVLYKESFC